MIDQLSSSLGVAGVVVFAGTVATCWRQIAAALKQFSNYLVGRAYLDHDAARAVFSYMASRKRFSGTRPRRFDACSMYVKSRRRREVVIYERLTETVTIVWYGWAPVLLAKGHHGSNTWVPVSLWWVRGTVDIERLLSEAATHVNERSHSSSLSKRFRVIRKVGGGAFGRRMSAAIMAGQQGSQPEPAGTPSDSSAVFEDVRHGVAVPLTCRTEELAIDATSEMLPFDVYSFDQSVLSAVEEVRTWHRSGDWYKDRGIPWTRGWLLEGRPGTGKTSLLRSIAQELDMPAYLFDLSSMSNEEFTEAWREAGANSPCMVVFEDIDAVFNGRENTAGEQGGGLTFDCLLNSVSGIAQTDGVFVAFTTNDLSKVDSAIAQPTGNGDGATRPGRVDRVIHMGAMSEACRRRHAVRVLGENNTEVEEMVYAGEGMTAAQFNDLCVRRALRKFWNSHHQDEVACATS